MTCLACHLACHGIDLQVRGGAARRSDDRAPDRCRPAGCCSHPWLRAGPALRRSGVAVEMVEILEQLETVVMSPTSALIGIGRQGNCSFKAFIDPILI